METMEPVIRSEQPYKVLPDSPHLDPLWMLQDLNNTDKHRMIPVSVIALSVTKLRTGAQSIAVVQGSDLVLEHDKVIWSFKADRAYPDIGADLTCAILPIS